MTAPPPLPEVPGTVLLTVQDGVGTLTLNRPSRRNAVSWQLVLDLVAALDAAREHPDLRVLVLTGAGKDFCVGADMARVGSDAVQQQETRTLRGRSFADDVERLTYASTATAKLLDFPVPTVAAVNGACAGAGLSLALATDLQVVAEHAVLNTAFVSAAVSGDLGSAWLITRAVGGARARQLLLDPVRLSGSEAAAIGLVTEATPDLPARVGDLTRKLAGQAPRAVRHARQNLRDAATSSFPEYLRQEVPRMVDCARTDDARRAAAAFLGKYTPAFTGD